MEVALVLLAYLALASGVAVASLAIDARLGGRSAGRLAVVAGITLAAAILLVAATLVVFSVRRGIADIGFALGLMTVVGATAASPAVVLAIGVGWLLRLRRPFREPPTPPEALHRRLLLTRVLASCAVLSAFVASSAVTVAGPGLGRYIVLVAVSLLVLLGSTAAMAGVLRPLIASVGIYRRNAFGILGVIALANIAVLVAVSLGIGAPA